MVFAFALASQLFVQVIPRLTGSFDEFLYKEFPRSVGRQVVDGTNAS